MTGKRTLTDAQVAEIRQRAAHEPYKGLAEEFAVDISYISRIYNGTRRNKRPRNNTDNQEGKDDGGN